MLQGYVKKTASELAQSIRLRVWYNLFLLLKGLYILTGCFSLFAMQVQTKKGNNK